MLFKYMREIRKFSATDEYEFIPFLINFMSTFVSETYFHINVYSLILKHIELDMKAYRLHNKYRKFKVQQFFKNTNDKIYVIVIKQLINYGCSNC